MLHKRFFPSYSQIQQSIIYEHQQLHQQKINKLQSQIEKLKENFHLQNEHEKIKNKLLQNYHAHNHQYMHGILTNLNQQDQRLQKDQTIQNFYTISPTNNQQSLNYCIDDDIEEDNHYENHLKFKKQVLDRQFEKHENHDKNKKNKYDEDFIFKNLYHQSNTTQNLYKFKEKKVFKPNSTYGSRSSKQNSFNFSKTPSKYVSRNVKEFSHQGQTSNSFHLKRDIFTGRSQSRKCTRKLETQEALQNHHEICQKNAKILKDSYGMYLKKLEKANIIKWRVFKS